MLQYSDEGESSARIALESFRVLWTVSKIWTKKEKSRVVKRTRLGKPLKELVGRGGFEPPTNGLKVVFFSYTSENGIN